MTLPKLDLPRYKHHLTGINKEIAYRPFTVREQKILLHAKEENTAESNAEAIKQIIELCTFNKVDPNTLPVFDIEDLFIRIRARSVSDVSTIRYKTTYTNEVGEEKTEYVDVEIDLNQVKVETNPDHSDTVMLTDTVGIKMKYPCLEMALDSSQDQDEMEVIRRCIDIVFDQEETYTFSEYSAAEQNEFIESFDAPALRQIKTFFDTMPRLRHTQTITVNGISQDIHFEGLQDFFA